MACAGFSGICVRASRVYGGSVMVHSSNTVAPLTVVELHDRPLPNGHAGALKLLLVRWSPRIVGWPASGGG